jgi:hypothetical protein
MRDGHDPVLSGLPPALIGGLLVLAQGWTVGLFGGYHNGVHWWSILLHVIVLGPLPYAAYLALSHWLRPPVEFQTGVVVAAIATSVILMLTQVLGGLSSSDLTLLKFLVTAYWTFILLGPALNRGTGWLVARLESTSVLPPRGGPRG